MKKNYLFLFISLVVFLCFTIETHSQWGSDIRLTTNSGSSTTSEKNNGWCVATDGSDVHVVWLDYRDFIWEIYYKRSIDQGVNWSPDIRLTNKNVSSAFPSVAVSGSEVHIVSDDPRDGGGRQIYYKRSTDRGVSWGQDVRLSNNTPLAGEASVAVSGSVVHVVWSDFRHLGLNFEIYYRRSTDGGVNWDPETRLTNDNAKSGVPSISVSGPNVHLVWLDNRDGNPEIYYKRSTDGGSSWGSDTRLTNDPFSSDEVSVAVSGSLVHVVWTDYRNGQIDIYYKRSSDGGVNWGQDTPLTNDNALSFLPSIAASGSAVHVVWQDLRDRITTESYEIYYKRSTDGGSSWDSDTRLTNNPASSRHCFVAASGSLVHVVWLDERDVNGNGEIYYKRNPTGNPTSIIDMDNTIPNDYILFQNYPNPFNPATTIAFSLPLASYVTLKVFNMLGQEVATILSEQLATGRYEIKWDATGIGSGVYFYRLQSGKFTDTKKLILLK